MFFERKKFFDAYNRHFPAINQIQVKGLERLLWGYETYSGWWDSLAQIANSLAQIKHETANSFHPVVEGYYLAGSVAADERYFQGEYQVVKNFQKNLKYYPYFGMGDIQLTWKENYIEQDAYLRKYFPEIVAEYNKNHAVEFNLAVYPAQVLDGRISFFVMTVGMHKGTFRQGQTLDRYINLNHTDHFGAREIVNGDKNYRDKQGVKIGSRIAANAESFEKILKASLIAETESDNLSEQINSLASVPVNTALNENFPASTETKSAAAGGGSRIPEMTGESQTDNALEVKLSETTATETGLRSLEVTEKLPPGDPPDAPARANLEVEDWKPWVFRKLKLTWTGFTGLNFSGGAGTLLLALKSGEYWYIPLIVAILLFIFSLIVCGLLSCVLLGIWHFNRKEIVHYKTTAINSILNPESFNLGLLFDKK